MSDKQPNKIGSTFVVMAHDGSATPVEVTEAFWHRRSNQRLGPRFTLHEYR